MNHTEDTLIPLKFQNIREIVGMILGRADGQMLKEIQEALSTIQVDLWLEQDRRNREGTASSPYAPAREDLAVARRSVADANQISSRGEPSACSASSLRRSAD